jgi:hypothetical protein
MRGGDPMGLTFNETKQCWHLRVDRVVNGVRQRASTFLPYGWTRDQAVDYAARYLAALSKPPPNNVPDSIDRRQIDP